MNLIGKNLKSIRKELGLTQGKFGEPLGITGGYVSDIERGKAVPKDNIFQLIEIYYHVNRNWLKTGEGEKYIGGDLATDIENLPDSALLDPFRAFSNPGINCPTPCK